MKKLFIIIIVFSQSVFSQWYIQSLDGSGLLFAIEFLDENTGFTVGDEGTILRTTDAGETWQLLPAPVTTKLSEISFGGLTHVYVAGDAGVLLCSTDLGSTWQDRSPDYWGDIYSIYFIDSLNGWAAGNDTLFVTSDGGMTWQINIAGENLYWGDVHFINDSTGFYAVEWRINASPDFKIYKTTNAGTVWVLKYDVAGTGDWANIFFLNNTIGFIASNDDLLLRTTDGGESWTNLTDDFDPPNPPAHFTGVHFVGNTGWVTCRYLLKLIIKTTDGGDTWNPGIEDNNPVYGHGALNDIYFRDTLNGWAVGWYSDPTIYSLILRTTNGGLTFIDEEPKIIPTEFKLMQNYPNPFNPVTAIAYSIPVESEVKLTVYNLNGEQITELVKGNQSPGFHEAKFDAANLSSGIYFYRLEAVSSAGKVFQQTKEMILLK